jgi:hypothetical protein
LTNHPFQLFRASTSELGGRGPALKSAAGPENECIDMCTVESYNRRLEGEIK